MSEGTASESPFRGVGPALVTPMHADGSLDLDGFVRHVERMISAGVHFLVPCGTTGESPTLSPEEQVTLIRKTVEVADDRVPVMAGAGTNDTRQAAALARQAEEAGADAILSVSPYYNKPTQEGIFRHYAAVAEAADLPVFVYNVPGRTASNVLPETVFRLAEEVDNVVGVKEASGDMGQAATLLRDRPMGLVVLSGDDELTLPMMALGAEGVVSVVANEAPARMAVLCDALLEGRMDDARTVHDLLQPLMKANFLEANPIPVKTALEMMGLMEAHVRLPLCEMGRAHRPALRKALEKAWLLEDDYP